MTDSLRDPELADSESADDGRASLNLACQSSKSKNKALPERGTWSTKLDFILSVVRKQKKKLNFFFLHHSHSQL